MKKYYNCPATEVIAVNAMTALCESQFGAFTNGGAATGTEPTPINPETGGL